MIGIDIRRYRAERTEAGRLATMLSAHQVNFVIDVGANIGQFAQSIRRAGYAADIYSIEPQSAAHQQLLTACQNDPRWHAAPRCAVGARSGRANLNISGNSVSSSLLRVLARHTEAEPRSSTIRTETVTVVTLDELLLSRFEDRTRPYLKIDTQGSEGQILDGAKETLGRCIGVQLELSLVPLYEGQAQFEELMDRMRQLGFNLWALWPGFFDAESGQMLQMDGVFFRDRPCK